ncbi:MAG: efflux RND transporter permease subunit, partial [Gammaproteobacteria bacterium]|nr:efflux RND transporter permease subunit [Gammaproteobacteria bacterium]
LTEIKAALYPLKHRANMSVSMFKFEGGALFRSPFTLLLSANDGERLNAFVKTIDEHLRDIEGVDSIQNPARSNQPNLRLEYQHARAEALGVDKSRVDPLIGMLTYGHEADRFRDSRGREFPILLKIRTDPENPLETLAEITVPTVQGGELPLNEVVKPVLRESESHIAHDLFRPAVEIDVWLKDGYLPETVAANVLSSVKELPLPSGISVEIGGALKQQQQDFQGLGKNALLTAMLVFAIFVLQFRSFVQPLIIFSAVPLCIIGAILGLAATGQPLTFFAAIGITSLMGIVVNDSILLVDEGNKIREEQTGQDIKSVAIEAGRKRFMPVLLTSITTIAGLLPLALTDNLFTTMAIAIIGGLISATFLILLLVPALYSFLSGPKSIQET